MLLYGATRPQCLKSAVKLFIHDHQLSTGSRLAPSQWETSLHSNTVSHWLGANLESAPQLHYVAYCRLMKTFIWPGDTSGAACFSNGHDWMIGLTKSDMTGGDVFFRYGITNDVLTLLHYNDIIIRAMASQITSLMIAYSTVYSGADQRKHQSSAPLSFVRGIHRGPLNSPHKRPVTREMFPFGDVIMVQGNIVSREVNARKI